MERRYHVALSDNERNAMLRILIDRKNYQIENGKSDDIVNDLLIKVGYAPKKKFKVVREFDEAR